MCGGFAAAVLAVGQLPMRTVLVVAAAVTLWVHLLLHAVLLVATAVTLWVLVQVLLQHSGRVARC